MGSPEITSEIAVPSAPANKDRRRRPRLACEASAEAAALRSEFLFRGTIRDISEGGCYFATPARLRLEVSAEIDLEIKMGGRRFRTTARVRSISPGRGLGLEFAFADAKAEAFIKNLVRELAS